MITNISLVPVYCLDQDTARDFYVHTLGFEPVTDITMGEGYRWVTVRHPSQPELQATLMTPGPPPLAAIRLPGRLRPESPSSSPAAVA